MVSVFEHAVQAFGIGKCSCVRAEEAAKVDITFQLRFKFFDFNTTYGCHLLANSFSNLFSSRFVISSRHQKKLKNVKVSSLSRKLSVNA